MRKTAVGYFEVPDWRYDISLYFRTLAADALSCPAGYICFHIGPDEFRRYGLHRTLDARVAQSVDNVENSFSPCLRDERACGPITDVDDYLAVADVDFFKIEARPCLSGYGLEVRVQRLVASHVLETDAVGIDR